jgi:TolA-binding protein
MKDRRLLKRPLLSICCGLVALSLAGCAPTSDNPQIQADQFALRGMVASDQQQIDSLQAKIQRLEDRVTELEHNGSASGAGDDQLASIEQRLSKLESQENSAQPGAANASSATPPNPPAPEGESEEATSETPATEAPGGVEGTAGAEAPTAPANPPAAPSAPSWRAMMDQELTATHDDPGESLYREGLSALKENKYPEALSRFEALQHRYPKSSLSEPAEFFAANALYEMGKNDQAILQFNDQTMRFPKGRFASSALLREAQAFMKINDRIDARLTLQKLLSDLPDSPEAPMAKSMMQTLTS